MLQKDFELWYRKNYEPFLFYKARWMIASYGKNFTDITELISQTVEHLYKNLDKIEEKTINNYCFITMQNTMRNMFVNGGYNKYICCAGDLGMSDWGTIDQMDNKLGNSFQYKLDQNKLIEKEENIGLRKRDVIILNNFNKADEKDKDILAIYSESGSIIKTSEVLNIHRDTVSRAIKRVKTGEVKKEKGFQNTNKNCYICGGKHFAKGLCTKHYTAQNYEKNKQKINKQRMTNYYRNK